MLNISGELVIIKNRLIQLLKVYRGRDLRDAVNDADRFINALHGEVLSARLIAADQVFSRFPRMVRDLAKSEGKQLEFVMSGTSVELDRAILERIYTPTIHLLRNAVDHGMEAGAQRASAGKPLAGKVSLSLTRSRNRAIIRVEDDGSGIDSDKIKAIALSKNLITKSQAEGIFGDDAFQLLFLPGFSSSVKVSETSGRGVGLNAVKAAMVQLGGSIEVHSQKGKGSTFEMSFPLSIAIVNSLLVSVDGQKYAIPMSHILRSAPLKALKVTKKDGRMSAQIAGENAALIELGRIFGIGKNASGEKQKVLLLESGSKKLGIIVDGIAERQGLLIKPLDPAVQKTRVFSGAAVLGSGEVALVVDVPAIFEKYELNES